MEGQTDGPSVFAIQVMATEGPLLTGPPWTATVKDGHAENGRANKPAVTPCPKTASSYARFLPLFHFLRLLDVHEMSLNFLRRTYVEGDTE